VSTAKHYNECIAKSKMNLGEIAEGTKKFMEMHSDLTRIMHHARHFGTCFTRARGIAPTN